MKAHEAIVSGLIDALAANPERRATMYEEADSILSALDKAGYAVVPKEPTEEMIEAGFYSLGETDPVLEVRVYKAMLAAASPPPNPGA